MRGVIVLILAEGVLVDDTVVTGVTEEARLRADERSSSTGSSRIYCYERFEQKPLQGLNDVRERQKSTHTSNVDTTDLLRAVRPSGVDAPSLRSFGCRDGEGEREEEGRESEEEGCEHGAGREEMRTRRREVNWSSGVK